MAKKGPRPKPIEERFWPRVRVGADDECWVWAGAKKGSVGYGEIGVGSRSDGSKSPAMTHRVVWELTRGSIPDGLCVLHKCDNPPCVNPSHLFLGTKADNTADMIRKGRMGKPDRRGEANGRAKLTVDQVKEIRARYVQGGVSHMGLAREYGMSKAQVGKIVRGEFWTHV